MILLGLGFRIRVSMYHALVEGCLGWGFAAGVSTSRSRFMLQAANYFHGCVYSCCNLIMRSLCSPAYCDIIQNFIEVGGGACREGRLAKLNSSLQVLLVVRLAEYKVTV